MYCMVHICMYIRYTYTEMYRISFLGEGEGGKGRKKRGDGSARIDG
jgi:hypothetical protein